jgi:hypothetical protein
MAQAIYDCGAKPEIELFDSGVIELARDMFADGSLRRLVPEEPRFSRPEAASKSNFRDAPRGRRAECR